AHFARARPVLRALGTRIHHLGPAGSGSTMKLISNHIAGITTLAIAEGLVLAAAAGVPAARTLDVCQDTVARSYVLDDDVRPRVLARDFEPGFTVDLYHKDLRLAAELAQALGVPLLFGRLTMEMFQMMRARGRGGRSHVDCVNFLAELAGVDVYRKRKAPTRPTGRRP
ncbi:MAG: NAD(P)-dependent oxidoreductase, partial [Alphaproteobacteria bacterium]